MEQESMYLLTLQTKNGWDAMVAAALSLDDVDEVIDTLDALKSLRDLFIRRTRRALERGQDRITHTTTSVLTADELREHNAIARRFELEKDEIEHLLASWEADKAVDDILHE